MRGLGLGVCERFCVWCCAERCISCLVAGCSVYGGAIHTSSLVGVNLGCFHVEGGLEAGMVRVGMIFGIE
jgi:hypothetical protein